MVKIFTVNHNLDEIEPISHLAKVLNKTSEINRRNADSQRYNLTNLSVQLVTEEFLFQTTNSIPNKYTNDEFSISVKYTSDKGTGNCIRIETLSEYFKWKEDNFLMEILSEKFVHKASIIKFKLSSLPSVILEKFESNYSDFTVEEVEKAGVVWDSNNLKYKVIQYN